LPGRERISEVSYNLLMSDWLKKQLERDRTTAEIDAARRKVMFQKGPQLWKSLQDELKDCVDMYQAEYPNAITFECVPESKIEIRRRDGVGILDLTYDQSNFRISFLLRNQAGSNEGVLDIDLNDRKECYLRQGMDRYEIMDDVSSFLLRPLLYG
jgi:hypothetical protein